MRLAFMVILLVSLATQVAADVKTIRSVWDFTGSATSFRLYKDGVLVGESFDTVNLEMDVEVDIILGSNLFTMTAIGPDGETPHSTPFELVYNPVTQTLNLKSVEILR